MFGARKTWPLLTVIALLAFRGDASAQYPAKESPRPAAADDFPVEMQKLRDAWVAAFNAGDAQKVAAFYAPEAVLMRWDGSVHGSDSILAEFQRSVSGGTHDYVVHSLHAERSGDLGYDTGAYNVTLRDRVVEGNYLVVVKRIGGEWKIVAHSSVANPAPQP